MSRIFNPNYIAIASYFYAIALLTKFFMQLVLAVLPYIYPIAICIVIALLDHATF